MLTNWFSVNSFSIHRNGERVEDQCLLHSIGLWLGGGYVQNFGLISAERARFSQMFFFMACLKCSIDSVLGKYFL